MTKQLTKDTILYYLFAQDTGNKLNYSDIEILSVWIILEMDCTQCFILRALKPND